MRVNDKVSKDTKIFPFISLFYLCTIKFAKVIADMPSFAELPAIKLNCLQMRKMCGVGITSFYQKFRNKISDGIAAITAEPKYQQWACCEFFRFQEKL